MPETEMPERATEDELEALDEERAFVELSGWRTVEVSGADASGWLQDLLTADVASLEPGESRRTLLLSATGRIKADLAVARRERDFLLLQPLDQPQDVGSLLAPYTLSSAVALTDSTNASRVFSVPGRAAERIDRSGLQPSVLGPGLDIVTGADGEAGAMRDDLAHAGLVEVGPAAIEVWRILRGLARMGPDFDQDSLPAEAHLESAIAFEKGCFLGQESAAKIRNLGHPPRVLRHVWSEGPLAPGDAVLDGSTAVGTVTSAAPERGRSVGLVRVRWEAAELPLVLADGSPLADVPPLG
jgi:folate-binding protein YgfZ